MKNFVGWRNWPLAAIGPFPGRRRVGPWASLGKEFMGARTIWAEDGYQLCIPRASFFYAIASIERIVSWKFRDKSTNLWATEAVKRKGLIENRRKILRRCLCEKTIGKGCHNGIIVGCLSRRRGGEGWFLYITTQKTPTTNKTLHWGPRKPEFFHNRSLADLSCWLFYSIPFLPRML